MIKKRAQTLDYDYTEIAKIFRAIFGALRSAPEYIETLTANVERFTEFNNNNNNNNNRICIAQVCRMTSEALDGQLQSCYTARARPKCLTEEICF